jgi:pentatricopeptide repeat protein
VKQDLSSTIRLLSSSSSPPSPPSLLTTTHQGLNHWIERLGRLQKSTFDHSLIGVSKSFDLLDQLVQEAEQQQQQQQLLQSTSPSSLSLSSHQEQDSGDTDILNTLLQSSDVLNLIIYAWSRVAATTNKFNNTATQPHHPDNTDDQRHHHDHNNSELLHPQQLVKLLDDYQQRVPSIRPDVKTYSMILHVVAKLRQQQHQQQISQHAAAEDSSHHPHDSMIHLSNTLFHRMNDSNDEQLRPDIVTFNTVLNTLSQSATPMAAQVAEDTLFMLLDQGTATPLSSSTTSTLNSLQPDVITFNTVMSAWAKAHQPERAEQVFAKMQGQYQTYGATWAKPTVQTYGILISAWGRVGKPKKAQAYFDEMCSRFTNTTTTTNNNANTPDNNVAECPQVEQYNALLHAWAVAGFPAHCESLLHRMMNTETTAATTASSTHTVQPNTTSFTIVLDAYAKSTSDPEAAERAQNLFFQILHYHNKHGKRGGIKHKRPETAVYRTMMHVWNRHAHHHPPHFACSRAMEVFQAMPKSSLTVQDLNVVLNAMAKAGQGSLALKWLTIELPMNGMSPDGVTYGTVLSAIATELRNLNQRSKNNHRSQSNHHGKSHEHPTPPPLPKEKHEQQQKYQQHLVDQAELLWEDMLVRGIHPNVRTLTALASVYSQRTGTDAATKAHKVLEQILDLVMESKSNSQHNLDALVNQVLGAWIQVGDCHQAELVWWRLRNRTNTSLTSETSTSLPYLTTQSLNLVLEGWSRLAREDPQAAERAEALLRKVQTEAPDDALVRPDGKSYREVWAAWSHHPQGQAKVEQLWQERISRLHAGERQLELNIADYNVMMRAMMKFGNYSRVKELFQQLASPLSSQQENVRPNATTFTIMIEAECCDHSNIKWLVRAQDLFREMVQLHNNGDESCQPTRQSFGLLIKAWAESKTFDGYIKADELLEEMLQRYIDGDVQCQPRLSEYHEVIAACAKAGDVERAERRLLQISELAKHLQHIRPNTITFNLVLSAWAKSELDGAAEHAEKILNFMENAGQEQCRPCVMSYTSVIRAWGYSQNPDALERIDALLTAMKAQSPDIFTYAAVVRAIARSDKSDKPHRIRNILRLMENQNLKLNSHVIEGILLACCTTRGNQEERRAAFNLACDMLQIVKHQLHSIQPLPNMLLFFLKTCVFVAEPTRETVEAAREAFDLCRRLRFDNDPRIQKAFYQSTRTRISSSPSNS